MPDNHQSTFFFRNEWVKSEELGTEFGEHSNHFSNGVSLELRSYAGENGVNIFRSNQRINEFLKEVQEAGLTLDFTPKDLLRIGHLLLDKNEIKDASIQLVAYAFNGKVQLMGSARECLPFAIKELLNVTTSLDQEQTGELVVTSNTLLINEEGNLTESKQGNFFLIKDEILYTPKLQDGAEPGHTRSSIIEGAIALGYPVIEKSISTQDLSGSEAAFFSSGESEMSFIERIDNFSFSTDWRNTIAHDLMLMLRQLLLNDDKIDYSII